MFLLKPSETLLKKASKTIVAKAINSPHGEDVVKGLTTICRTTTSAAKVLHPKLVGRFSELNSISGRLWSNQSNQGRSLFTIQVRKRSVTDVICFPAKAVSTSLLYGLYAVLIYLSIYINLLVGMMKALIKEEDSTARDRQDGAEYIVSRDGATANNDGASPERQAFLHPLEETGDGGVRVLHSVFDEQVEEARLGQ
ncbi:hypothetical protein FKM82_020148 [Ascaphus truei]